MRSYNVTGNVKNDFNNKLLNWYQSNKRDLPWRRIQDPYLIWISEIILQQTRINQGRPYYLRFIKKYPDIYKLANAEEEDILALWQGLGYYTRARNMHKCARIIVNECEGNFPSSFNELKKLPGIGTYTAAAMASISFNEPIAVMDGNVFRVLARFFGIKQNPETATGKKIFNKTAQHHIAPDQPGEYNQAVMEFGAMHCTPSNPNCNTCILNLDCFAYKNDMQSILPVKYPKKKSRLRYFHYLIISIDDSILMKKRDGLYDFYLEESDSSRKIKFEELHGWPSEILHNGEKIEFVSKEMIHVLTHQKIHGRFYHLHIKNKKNQGFIEANNEYKFYKRLKINDLPKSMFIT
ncbi:A/G-specific adenine glycosylase [Bacteroidota bacterium]